MDVQQKLSTRGKVLLLAAALSVVLVSLVAYTKYMYAQDYTFLIEAACNPEEQTCYVRDCDDYCPPNGFSEYRVFAIRANEFKGCTDNACSNICLNQESAQKCEEILCDIENGDDCSI